MKTFAALALALLACWPARGRAQAPSEAEPPAEETAEPAPAEAPESAALSAPAPSGPVGQPVAEPSRRERRVLSRAGSDWKGPRVELAYRLYSLRDAQGGRNANTACFSGFLPTRKFRGGGGVEAGARGYEYGSSEGLVSGNVFAGYQHLGGDLGRVVPYLVAVGELGVLFGQRFHTPMSRMLRGAGMELGADVNLVRGLYLGLGVGFMLYTMDELSYDSWGMRLSIGL
jgi:hypothetical protein